MNFSSQNTEDLIEIFKNIKSFLTFLEKENENIN